MKEALAHSSWTLNQREIFSCVTMELVSGFMGTRPCITIGRLAASSFYTSYTERKQSKGLAEAVRLTRKMNTFM